MKKVIKDGKVAVLYSPGYGAGWYSWNIGYPECMFHPDLVKLVEKRNAISKDGDYSHKYKNNKEYVNLTKKIEDLAKKLFGKDFYSGGARDLQIEWIEEGTSFRIGEYDGYESIKYLEYDDVWTIA